MNREYWETQWFDFVVFLLCGFVACGVTYVLFHIVAKIIGA